MVSWIIAGILVVATVVTHYEALRFLDWAVARLPGPHRWRIVLVMLGCFCAHIVEVIVFAAGLYSAATWLQLGTIEGTVDGGFGDYIYFSLVNYTSLGIGDIYPTGDLRLLAGVEALAGLMMITWSATFTFLEMRNHWDDRKPVARDRSPG